MTHDHRADLFATAYLAAHHEDPLNTRRTRFQSLASFRLAAIMGDIDRPEQRLSYETGLTDPELSAINLLIRHTKEDQGRLAAWKMQGVDFADLEAALSRFEVASPATRILRATYIIDYLEWLMKVGDGVLTRYVVSDKDIEARRKAFAGIRRCITKPKVPGRVRRTVFTGSALATLEKHMETYDPAAIWKDRLTALRNSTMCAPSWLPMPRSMGWPLDVPAAWHLTRACHHLSIRRKWFPLRAYGRRSAGCRKPRHGWRNFAPRTRR